MTDSHPPTPPQADVSPSKSHGLSNSQVAIAIAPLEPEPEAEPVDSTAATAVAVQDTAPPRQRKSKILFLDGLRGLAAILVVLTHAGYMQGINLGPQAVDTFFVLSAFLLTLIFETKARELFRQKASYGRWALALTDYFVRRFLRVYPLFAIVAVVLVALSPEQRARCLAKKHPIDLNLLDVLSFQSHPHILWTLPIEISYYFMIPVFVIVELKMGRLWWLLGLAGYALVFYNGLYQWKSRKQHHSPWPHYPTFLCGSLAAVVYSRLDRFVSKHKFVFKPWLVVILQTLELLVVVLLLSQLFRGLLFHWIGPNPLPDSNRFVSFSISLLIVCEMLNRGLFASVLEWSLLRFAGKVSYSMYLLHIFVVNQPEVLGQKNYYDKYFMIWILVFPLSTASYYAIEWPSQRLTTRISGWIKQQDAALSKEPGHVKTVKINSAKASEQILVVSNQPARAHVVL